ncbi:MAG: Hint domain-containing protein [Ruegeria sp.]|uniref:Hint domain-containing protein n=1 Tax=Ruegeria sp. TaxID=1879320 RepID=UPI00349E5FBA
MLSPSLQHHINVQLIETAMIPDVTWNTVNTIQQPAAKDSALSEAGFLPGTLLLTQDGELPVEYLSKGDRIITRNAGLVRIAGIGHGKQRVRAIRFAAGSSGDTRPESDLTLPAGQQVLVRDWRAQAMFGRKQALVRADALVDGMFVRDLGTRDLSLFQLYFDASHILYAGGFELAGHGAPAELRPAA